MVSDLLEIPEGWPEESYVRHRIDRELELSLIRGRDEYAERRKRMPVHVRRKEDGEE
jgi:hypothetical protein